MGQLLLACMELFAACTASYGFYYTTFELNTTFIATIHNCLWFIMAIVSNLSGLTSIVLEAFEGSCFSPGQPTLRSLYLLQYHYFFSWLGVLVGYAGLVTSTWMVYYPMRLSHMHIALVGVPIVAWLKRKSTAIVVTTQVITVLAILSHAYISSLAGNYWGVAGAILMSLQILSMSLPLRYTFLTDQFSTREASILFCGINSLIFSASIAQASNNPKVLKKL